MVVKINLDTGKRTVVEPLNDQDKKKLQEILFNLYLINEKKVDQI